MSSSAAPAPPPPRSGLRAAWSRLDHRQRRVGAASLLVLATMVLPWYSEETATRRGPDSFLRTGGSVSGLAGMSYIEASLLVVLIGVAALLWGRATGRRFALPFPDGTLICAAAGWMGALIVYRLFSRPHGEDSAQELTVIGLNWGIFASLLAVGVLFAAGFDLRRHGPRSAVPGEREPASPSDYPDVDPATIVARPRPAEGETAVVPAWRDDQPTAVVPSPRDDQPTAVVPSPRAEEQPTRQAPAVPPRSEEPTRQAPAVPPPSEEQPTAVSRPVRPGRRVPTPPAGSTDGEPGYDAWPSRMRRPPHTPTPRDPAVERPADPADAPRRDAPDERR